MSNNIIACTAPIDQIAIDVLKPFGEFAVAADPGEEALVAVVKEATALIVRGGSIATARVIGAGPHLKVIARPGIGYETVDIQAATARRIPVVYVPAAGARAVAEGAATFMIALAKRIVQWDQECKRGNWDSRYASKPGDLDGAMLGIIGLGNSGQVLAQMMRPFNMRILAYDPYASRDRARELGVELVSFEEMLPKSDFVSLHVPVTPETRALINRRTIKLFKPGACLINIARGKLIESLDLLVEALESGALAGVGLDVFEPEPPDFNHPLFRQPNCLTSPHALAMTTGAMFKVFKSMAEDVAAVLSGNRPRFVVNPEVFE
jgi:phosphoglycerate dehydrogenase-like enzyme